MQTRWRLQSSLVLCCSHPLPKAVLLLCKAVQTSLSPLKGDAAAACLSLCDRGSSYLCSSISVPLAQAGNLLNKVNCKDSACSGTRRLSCAGCVCVCGGRWLWCIVVALHDPEAECDVSAVQHRGLSSLLITLHQSF